MCSLCGDATNELHVHHAYYVSQREPWGYPDYVLSTVCKACHGKECLHGTDAIERFIDAVSKFARDHRDFEDLLSTLRIGLDRSSEVKLDKPIVAMSTAAYALQRSLKASEAGHEPEAIKVAIDVAFNQFLGETPKKNPHEDWLIQYIRHGARSL